jgi:tetratricopeptide (TPR) repeat protein
VARLRNPLDGLAYAVLALVAGLSTAEGGDMMRQALAADPFLRASARPAGWPPFQRGVIQPFVARWDELAKKTGGLADPEFEKQIALGKRLYEARQWEEANEAFIAAEALETDSHLPRLYLARIRMDSGDPAGAMEDLRILAGEYPQESEVWFAYGLTLEAGELFIEAEEAFRRALEERPDEPNALYHLALAQVAREHWQDARNTLRILTERNTRHGQGWLLLGTTELQLENWRDAHAAFRQALQVDPQNEKARAGMKLAVEKAKAAQEGQQ